MFLFHVTWFSFIMNCLSGETPGEGFPSCYFTNSNSPLPALRKHRGVSPSADGDQGLCPWTLVPFLLCISSIYPNQRFGISLIEKKGTQKA